MHTTITKKYLIVILLSAVLLSNTNSNAQSEHALSHFGLVTLTDNELATQFATRLAAKGTPLFIIADISRGVSQGDLLRFKDKAVLIDADIWQTMMSMGILNKLKNIPVMTLTAKAKSDIWESRSDLVSKSNENKGYTLGRELLKIFEDYFGKTPSGMEMVIKFDNGYMSIVVPNQLMNELNFVNVVRMQNKPQGKPFFITTEPPVKKLFTNVPFSWKIWALDPSDPTGQLLYTCTSELPSKLTFDQANHTLAGTPDTAGIWTIAFTVRNSKGISATLQCTISTCVNTAPRVQATFDEPVLSGTTWEYLPFIADAEHTLDELEIRLFNAPAGMVLDSLKKVIIWNIPDAIQDTSLSFIVAARDPLNAIAQDSITIHVLSPALANRSLTIDFKLPIDTLIQGHKYSWSNDTWMKAEWKQRSVLLASVKGADSTHYTSSDTMSGGALQIFPQLSGTHNVQFVFNVDTMQIVVNKIIAVKPNRPPVFKSKMMVYELCDSQIVRYQPVVTDPDQDSIIIEATTTDGTHYGVPAKGLLLQTKTPGLNTLLLTAKDPYGNSAVQQIYYTIKKQNPPATRQLEFFAQFGNRQSTDIGFQSNGARIGLYSTNITKTLTTGFLGINSYETPFLFFGCSALGQQQATLGNYLFFDGGMSFRMYNQRLFGGGLMARMQSNYRKKGTSSWRFSASGIIRLKQAIFVADTTGLIDEFKQTIDGPEDITDPKIKEYVDKLLGLFGEYGKEDNFGIHLQFQTLYKGPFNFWLGPTAWIEDHIRISHPKKETTNTSAPPKQASNSIGNIFVQYSGICLLHEWHYKRLHYSQQIYTGWRGNSFIPKTGWNCTVKLVNR